MPAFGLVGNARLSTNALPDPPDPPERTAARIAAAVLVAAALVAAGPAFTDIHRPGYSPDEEFTLVAVRGIGGCAIKRTSSAPRSIPQPRRKTAYVTPQWPPLLSISGRRIVGP